MAFYVTKVTKKIHVDILTNAQMLKCSMSTTYESVLNL